MHTSIKVHSRKNAKKVESHSLFISYTRNGKIFRHFCQISISKKEYFNKKTSSLTGKYKHLNGIVLVEQIKVENAIKNFIEINTRLPSVNELKEFLGFNKRLPKANELKEYVKHKTGIEVKKSHFRIDQINKYLQTYLQDLKKQHRTPATIRTYETLIKDLEVFCKEKNFLSLKNLNREFLQTLEDWYFAQTHIFKNKSIPYADATIKKRLDQFSSFLRWLKGKAIFDKSIFEYKIFTSNNYSSSKVHLTKEELKKLILLQETKDLSNIENIVIDLMIFMCMTGLYLSDLLNIKKQFISDNQLIIRRYKNNEKCYIPLNKTAIEILKKYNYNFNNNTSEQHFNRTIKEILKTNDICSYSVSVECWQRNKPKYKECMKYNCITAKSGRYSFVNALLDANVNIADIRNALGHKTMAAIESYIKERGANKNSFTNAIDF